MCARPWGRPTYIDARAREVESRRAAATFQRLFINQLKDNIVVGLTRRWPLATDLSQSLRSEWFASVGREREIDRWRERERERKRERVSEGRQSKRENRSEVPRLWASGVVNL